MDCSPFYASLLFLRHPLLFFSILLTAPSKPPAMPKSLGCAMNNAGSWADTSPNFEPRVLHFSNSLVYPESRTRRMRHRDRDVCFSGTERDRSKVETVGGCLTAVGMSTWKHSDLYFSTVYSIVLRLSGRFYCADFVDGCRARYGSLPERGGYASGGLKTWQYV
ncbi:hypothetical protein M011DRAFT_349817 [Sporormia fimetaria CBS 119925]|uniref:Secreted protein n=1 Tax=Sporormia fimetaria CBS 119925 TaxID=1340428 RepID=A0A6A6VH79_9PLEO|nr:hypothetical protein M011DRAFT_349817 [Sporormia fimetaria CBS 119925]